MKRTATLVLSLALMAVHAAPAEAQLATTKRSHYQSGPAATLGGPGVGSLREFRGPNYKRRVLLRRRADLQRIGPPDPNLSRACRKGLFRQVIDRRYVAVLADKTYGAAIGGGPTLFDPRRNGQTGLVYVFTGQGTTNCLVFIGGAPNAG